MKLKLGVLIVGSLDWESKDYGGPCKAELQRHGRKLPDHRKDWRKTFLSSAPQDEFRVAVPIRYGRPSSSRSNRRDGRTYTMVFSPEYDERPGAAKAVRCKREVSSIVDLAAEAEELWVAESSERHRGELSAEWGCVTLVKPDGFLKHPDRADREKLLADWNDRTAKESSYGRLAFSGGDETKGKVIEKGVLQIPWPRMIVGDDPLRLGDLPLDLLLATATNPEIKPGGSYPSVAQIADAWRQYGHVYYFHCNRLCKITTADDEAIAKLL